jgi:3-oxoacyl-[acyl-carrier protein] reductase
MDLELKGKNALVTGSSKGIGFSIATLLHKEGCNVTINGRNRETLQNAFSSFKDRIHACTADVTKPEDCKMLVKETIKQWGSIDILVCNVGDGTSVEPGSENFEELERVFRNNFYSSVNVINSAKNELSKTHGSIACISSIAGIETLGAPVTYSISKAALNSYVKNMSKPLAKQGIRINAVVPGNVFFDGSVWEKKLSENPLAVENMLKNEVALQRFGRPEEIANAVVFLISEKSSFVTGSLFVIDGGQTNS